MLDIIYLDFPKGFDKVLYRMQLRKLVRLSVLTFRNHLSNLQ